MTTGILDTRDLHERLEELRELRDQLAEDLADELGDDPAAKPSELDEEDARELADLEYMESGISDWQYGEALIPEDEFEDYARELASDIGAIPENADWPASYIDWTAAADALKMDYTAFELNGTTYYCRA